MIKAETIMSKGKTGAKITVEGSIEELTINFMGILDALEKKCPEVVIVALQTRMEDMLDED